MNPNDLPAPAGQRPPNIARAATRLLKRLVMDGTDEGAENRRLEERISVAGEVTIVPADAGGADTPGTRVFVRDLSRGGCGLWSRVGFPQGARLVVRFPGVSGGPPVQRLVEVCHCRGAQGTGFAIGCRFIEGAAEAA